jgi:hypothetical protein
MRARLAVVGASVALALGGLAACSAQPDVVRADAAVKPASAADALKQASDKTTVVTTARVSVTLDATGVPGVDNVDLTIDGAVDNQAKRSMFSVDLSKLSGSLPSMPASAISSLLGDGKVDVVTDGANVYVKLGGLASILGATSDKSWVEISGTGAAQDAGTSFADGAAVLKLLESAGGVTKVGSEQVRGVDTTHYSASLDLATALAQLNADDRAKAEDQLGRVGIDPSSVQVPVDVWIDNDGLVRRVRIGVQPPSGETTSNATAGTSGTLTVEFYDFGQPVAITVPSADQVFKLDPSMLGGLVNGLGGLAGNLPVIGQRPGS